MDQTLIGLILATAGVLLLGLAYVRALFTVRSLHAALGDAHVALAHAGEVLDYTKVELDETIVARDAARARPTFTAVSKPIASPVLDTLRDQMEQVLLRHGEGLYAQELHRVMAELVGRHVFGHPSNRPRHGVLTGREAMQGQTRVFVITMPAIEFELRMIDNG